MGRSRRPGSLSEHHVFARRRLFPLIEEVDNGYTAVEIVSKNASAYLVSAAEYESLQETAYLLRSPANARRLLSSYQEAIGIRP